jgi:hypothetical protein
MLEPACGSQMRFDAYNVRAEISSQLGKTQGSVRAGGRAAPEAIEALRELRLSE